jgi:hypothetical protein
VACVVAAALTEIYLGGVCSYQEILRRATAAPRAAVGAQNRLEVHPICERYREFAFACLTVEKNEMSEQMMSQSISRLRGAMEGWLQVSPFLAWIGSPCLRDCVHGATITRRNHPVGWLQRMGAALPGGGGGGGVAERRLWLLRNTEMLLEKIEALEGEDGESKRPVVESPWSQFSSECQCYGQPPRLDNPPL